MARVKGRCLGKPGKVQLLNSVSGEGEVFWEGHQGGLTFTSSNWDQDSGLLQQVPSGKPIGSTAPQAGAKLINSFLESTNPFRSQPFREMGVLPSS